MNVIYTKNKEKEPILYWFIPFLQNKNLSSDGIILFDIKNDST